MSQRPIGLGILGCGRIVRKMIPALRGVEECRLVAISSSRPGVAAEWGREFDIERTCDSHAALLADPDVEAVYIPATGDLHHPLTLAAAAAGKHVLCEKPLAASLPQAEEMVQACARAGVLLQEAFMWRHHPRATATRELLCRGAIGELRLINVSFSFLLQPDDWRMRPERGGGAMWDIGCYGVDAARYFTQSEPRETYARARFAGTGIDLSMQAALRFPGDVLTQIDCSFEVPWRCRLELVGTAGRIEWPCAFQHWEPVIHLYHSSDWKQPPEVLPCEDVSQYACQVRAFCTSIRAGRLLPPAEDGLANMRVLAAAYTQAQAAIRSPDPAVFPSRAQRSETEGRAVP